jgi:sugar/nucleoside kinase (ribokinase family)
MFEALLISIMNCTGACNTMTGAFIHALLNGHNELDAVKEGMGVALFSLQCEDRAIASTL